MIDHKTVYRTSEFDEWAFAKGKGIAPEEDYVIEHFLDKSARTLEAGTGGGRVSRELLRRGFTALSGFDYVPEFIEEARKSEPTGRIEFAVEDATALSYPDASFDQILYMQNILCFLDDEGRAKALREAYRVLRPGGTGLFSVLSYEVRSRSWFYGAYLLYLRLLRRLRGSKLPPQYLPWLKRSGRPNLAALLDRGPHTYWPRVGDFDRDLKAAGFRVRHAASQPQLLRGRMCDSADQLAREPLGGELYYVCAK